jgi:hypothetical protein
MRRWTLALLPAAIVVVLVLIQGSALPQMPSAASLDK